MAEIRNVEMTIDTVDRQLNYVKTQQRKGKGLGIVFADAFLRGMRDIGYKSPAWALSEQSDNSFQAGAEVFSIRFGFTNADNSKTKPAMLAIIDNGNGMIPEMISYAVRWGGTDREGDRKGFGRYGYGLPSSAVSLAKRYTVYSKVKGGGWHAVTVDLDELAKAAGDIDRTEKLLSVRPEELPAWVIESEDELELETLDSGTIIVLEDLDRLRALSGWIKADTLKTKLLQHFGVIYRHFIPGRRILVDGVQAQAVDPLFLMEHARFFDETPVRAERVEARTFEVTSSRGTKGRVSIRASVLPPNFQLVDPSQYGVAGIKPKMNKRFDIMKNYNGIIICREGRQIDTIIPRWTKFQNYDMNIKIEINFDAELDEHFGITTAKQQIVIDDEMLERLQHDGKDGGGLITLVRDLRTRRDELEDKLKAEAHNQAGKDQPRPSAIAMQESEKFKGITTQPTPDQQQEASRNLEQAAAERSRLTGKPKEEEYKELEERTAQRRWDVEFSAIPEGPFYRPHRLGQQKLVILNTDHPFYPKMYESASPDVRSALEVMLFVLAERELDSKGDAAIFYKAERQKWSERLRHAFDTLVTDESMIDKANAMAEKLYVSATEG